MIQLVSLLGFLALIAFGVMAAEYTLTLLYPEWILEGLIPAYGIKVFRTLILPARIVGPGLYFLLFMLLQMDPAQSQRKEWKPSKALSWTALIVFSLCWMGFLGLEHYSPHPLLLFMYPGLVVITLISAPLGAKALRVRTNSWGIKNPKKKQRGKLGFYFRLKDGWINVANPFRGMLVIGAAGSGKSYSIAEPLIYQAAARAYTGILYDFKFPTLTNTAYRAYQTCPRDIRFYVLNFTDLSRSHRVNPLRPENLPVIAYAEEYAQAIMANLMPETIEKKDFWIRSATAILTATIWYIKKHYPAQCTLPHVVAIICNKDFEKLLPRLEQDPETMGLIASLSTAMEKEADKQLAGVMASVQIALSRIHTPQIAWVISGDDVDLQLNNPQDLKLLSIGSDASLSETLAPVISCIITVALKKMNRPGHHHSLILLDEGPTLYIPKFDQIPATARSNKLATIYMAQDISQMVQSYGPINAEVILGNLNSQLFGRASNQRTAEYVSAIFGKEEKETPVHSQNLQKPMTLLYQTGYHQKAGQSVSYQSRETLILRPQQVMNLEVGEFVGLTAGKRNEQFMGKIKRRRKKKAKEIPAFATGVDVYGNFERICREALSILTK